MCSSPIFKSKQICIQSILFTNSLNTYSSSFFPKYPNFKEDVHKLTGLINNKTHIDNNINKKEPESNEIKQIRLKPILILGIPKKIAQNQEDSIDNKNTNNDLEIRNKDASDDDDKKQQQQQIKLNNNSNQLLAFPTFEKKLFLPEVVNDNNPYRFPTDFTKKLNHKISLSMETIDKILDILHEPLDFIFSDTLIGYFVTNSIENITIFNQALFLASAKPEDLAFYEFLLESQTFQDYVENKLDQFTKSKCTDPSQRRKSTFCPKGRKRALTVRKLIKGIG